MANYIKRIGSLCCPVPGINPDNEPSVGNVIMAKYRTTSPQENVRLMGWTETDAETGDEGYSPNFVLNLLKKVEIDGVEVSVADIDNDYGTYTFATVGEHSVNFTLKDEITSIPFRTFRLCDALTSVIIPNSVTSIGDDAFGGCTSLPVENNLRYADTFLVEAVDKTLTTYTIKSDTKWIGQDAFDGCTNLTSITIPSSVTSIGSSAFSLCGSLTSITIPSGVTTIGNYAFYGCTSLPVENYIRYADTYLVEVVDKTQSSYTIKSVTKWIGDNAFDGCSNLTSITIPNGVISIGNEAFYNCSGLTSITIPNGVISIGSSAFDGCTNLTNVTIPNGVIIIGSSAFDRCYSLTNITIPNSVTNIGREAFWFCLNLSAVTCLPTIPPILDSNIFRDNASGRKIYVPSESVNAYKAATNWSDYASDIEPIT